MAVESSAVRLVFPKEAFLSVVMLISRFFSVCLRFWTPSQSKSCWWIYSKKLLWCQRCSVESLDCTTWHVTVDAAVKWHITRGRTSHCALDLTLWSETWFTISHRHLATFIGFVYYCRCSSKAVWEHSGHSFHKLKRIARWKWFAASFQRSKSMLITN